MIVLQQVCLDKQQTPKLISAVELYLRAAGVTWILSILQDKTVSVSLYFQITVRLQASDKHHTTQHVIVQNKLRFYF